MREVRSLGVVSPLSLDLLTHFAANFVGFSDEVVANFGVAGDNILAVMKIFYQCFLGKNSTFTGVSEGVFPPDQHCGRGRYTSDRGINYEDNFVIPKSEIYHAVGE